MLKRDAYKKARNNHRTDNASPETASTPCASVNATALAIYNAHYGKRNDGKVHRAHDGRYEATLHDPLAVAPDCHRASATVTTAALGSHSKVDSFHTDCMRSNAEHFQSQEIYALLALRQFTYYKQWVLCTPVIFSLSRDD
ncbi:hypothetical protein [Pseudomonas triticifolii]|uniref:Uncharacterized protein n=1 Tax=Pseudomonas triticifolii TaxID=2762592 RepID=A0ABR7BAI4_9PSED|nr:hypothetical protein [Pseudomonas triticifolii]MBC3954183.1 hypothetical protein [Pseudomonas triticifolii]